MFEDATKGKELDEPLKIRDIAEIMPKHWKFPNM
jgi:hypothetical protein